MDFAKDVLSKMHVTKSGVIVKDWKSLLPPGSRWNPGDPGNPSCGICQGTGYVRMDLPIGHPDFGKIFYCDCVDPAKINQLRAQKDENKRTQQQNKN
jgi:hypothetical protein